MEQSATDAVGVLQDFIEETVSLKDRLRWRNQSVVQAPKDETVEVCCYVQDEYGVALKRGFLTGAEAARIDGEVYWRPELPVPPISELPFEPRIEESEKPQTQVVMHGWCDASERGGMMGLGLKLVKDGNTVFKGFGMRDAAQAGSTYCELQGIVLLVRIAKSMGCTHLYLYNDNQPEKAAEAYKQVISKYPGSEEAKVALQDLKSVYIDLNDIDAYAAYVNSLGGNIHLNINEQDSLTYIAAEKLFMRGDNEGARRSMQNYLQNYPNGAFSTNANFYLASIAFNLKEYNEALPMFEQVIASGDRKFLEESTARKAEIEYLTENFKAALETFKRLNEIAESADNKEAASLGIMRCALKEGNQKDALAGANQLLKNPKVSPEIANEARYVRAKAYMEMDQESKALTDLKLISQDTRTAQGAEAKYLLAQLYYDANDDKNAEKVLEEFAKNGTPHQYWLARGFILWADIYIRKGDPVQARVYLNSLQKNYQGDDNITEMIESRLAKLK